MADLNSVNYPLERKKLEHAVKQQETNLAASEMRELTIQAELDQIEGNKAATNGAIADLQQKLAELGHQEQQAKESQA